MEDQTQQKEKGGGRQDDEFDSRLLDLARVGRMTAGGRRLRFRAAVIVGDKKGRVGFGIGKGNDVAQAIDKATRLAKKELLTVVSTKDGTIPHESYAKFGAAEVLLRPQSQGRGLIAGGVPRTICQLAGIDNISAKILGNTRNKINNARATLKALSQLKQKDYATASSTTENEAAAQ